MAGDTFTEFLNLTKPEIGGSRDSWGQKINGAFDAIDTWAKATDTLAKNALSRTATGAQYVAGATTFSSRAEFPASLNIPENQYAFLGKGYIRGEAGRTLIAAAADTFEVVNQANSAYILQATASGTFAFRGQSVWHTGNLTPANYFDKATATGQNVNNIPSFNASAIDIVRANVLRARFSVDGGGTTILSNGDTADNIFYVTRGGAVWTKEFGDLNNRIENRASAFANNALATARAEYAGHAKLAGATFTGEISSPGITATGGNGHVSLQSRDGGKGALIYNAGSLLRFYDTAGADRVRFNLVDGSIWTNQFGDVHNRIEDRAYAWANDRLNIARNEYGLKFDKSGGAVSGDITIGSKEYPAQHLYWHGIIRAGWMLDNDASVMWRNSDSGDVMHRLYTNGAVWTKQFGDLNQRIEDRAYAYRNDAINVMRNETSNAARTNVYNTFTQDQVINKAYPGLRLLYPGVREWFFHMRENGALFFFDNSAGEYTHEFKIGGAYRNNQIGDLNDRIESRANAYATDRANEAKNEANRITGRLAYAGDLDNGWNINTSYAEPYQGGVLTSRYTTNNPYTVSSWQGGRWRFMQMKGTNDSWYTIAYV